MTTPMPIKERSSSWFLVPFFFGIIGGVIAYLIIKEDDKRKANYCLALGIVMTVIGFIIVFAIGLNAVHNMQQDIQQPLTNSQPITPSQTQSQTQQNQKQTGQFTSTDCHRDQALSSVVHMTGKYTNGQTAYSFVYLQLALLDEKGTVVATGNGVISDISPYQTKIFDTTAIYSGNFTSCQVEIGSAD